MATQSQQLHVDSDGKRTSAVWSDDGDGTNRWLLWSRNAILELVARTLDAAAGATDRGIMALAVRRDTPAGPSTDGDYASLSVNSTGHLLAARAVDGTDAPSLATNGQTAADDLVVKASAGRLHGVAGTVLSGEDGYILAIDATSQPSDGAVAAELTYPVAAASADVAVNIPLPGHAFGTGIVLVWSTTSATLTAGSAKLLLTAYYD